MKAKKCLSTIFISVLSFLIMINLTCLNIFVSAISEDTPQVYNSTNPLATYTQQAEVWALNGCSVGTYGSGYSGNGYVEYINEIGDGISCNYDATAGYYSFVVKYSQGTGQNQTLSLFVGGKFVKKINFAPTGDWDTSWGVVQEFFYMPSGITSIELKYTAGDGDVDLDYINCYRTTSKEIKMVIVPHEDDEVFAFCGSIQSMIEAGDEVRVVLVTNGDYNGMDKGLVRISESINALAHVGVEKENIIFMAYGDGIIYDMFYASPDTIITPFKGHTLTYGDSSINVYDYHTLQTGSAASYTRNNLISDLQNIISVNMPSEIFTMSFYDTHPDHSATYSFVKETIENIRQNHNYSPLLHESVVHGQGGIEWPVEYDSYSPAPTPVPFTNPFPSNNVPLYWANATKIQLTDDMLANKYAAIGEYQSQMGAASYNYAFYKSDEFYWTKDYSNIATNATVTASSQNTSTNQLAANVIDGYIAGHDMHEDMYKYEWASYYETTGAWIQLSFDDTYSVNKIVFNDRINNTDNILSARLNFSDGTSILVTDIPTNGTDCVVSFDTKNITWVRLTVMSASGYSVGLTEFQVMEA